MLGKIKKYGFRASKTSTNFKSHSIIEKGKRIIKIIGKKARKLLISTIIASMLFAPLKTYPQSFSVSTTKTPKTTSVDFTASTNNRLFSGSATLSYDRTLHLQRLELLRKVFIIPFNTYGKAMGIARYYRDLRIGNKGGPFAVLVFNSKYGKLGLFYGIASHVSGKTIYPHGIFLRPSINLVKVKIAGFNPVKNSYIPTIVLVSTDVEIFSVEIEGKTYGIILHAEAGRNIQKGKTLFISIGGGIRF